MTSPAKGKVNIMQKFQDKRFVLVFVFLVCLIAEVRPTSCPIDPALEATQPGNSYECPDLLPNGQPNEYNFCCHNDRPDENGDYHSCCQDPDAASADKMKKFIDICIIIVCATITIMISVFVYTYCHDDTFPCLIPLKKEVKRWKDLLLDSICFCSCCPKALRRKTKKEMIAEKELERAAAQDVDPSQMDVPHDDFWI